MTTLALSAAPHTGMSGNLFENKNYYIKMRKKLNVLLFCDFLKGIKTLSISVKYQHTLAVVFLPVLGDYPSSV